MKFLRNRTVLALAIVALAQTSVLASMVIDRTRLLKSGREITLPVRPVDPRDLFRGEYVRLGYDISSVPVRLLEGAPPERNAPVYVVLEKSDGDVWLPIKLTASMPRETSPTRIVMKGRAMYDWPAASYPNGVQHIQYGIEGYFVREGDGARLEKLARESPREKKLTMLIAVDNKGNAAIKGIAIDGVLQYEEPLF